MNNNAVDSNTIIEKQLDEGIRNLQEIFDVDLLTFIGLSNNSLANYCWII